MSGEFTLADLAAIDGVTREVGRSLFDRLERRAPTLFERRWWDDRIMAWAMQDESVKVQMFRFIDVLPMLHDSADVTRHLHEYFHEVDKRLPSAVRIGLAMAKPDSVAGRALAIAARKNAQSHARRFIAGTTIEEVLAAAKRARKLKMAFTLDLLGEAVTSQTEADRYSQAYLDLIRDLSPSVNSWPEVPQIDRGVLTELPRVNVSVKLTALDSQFDPLDWDGTTRRVAERLRTLLRAAREHQAFVNVDMESFHTKYLTLHIFQQVLMEDEFRKVGDVGIVIQCYLKDSGRDLRRLRDWAKLRGHPVWVRLVKGAYWDYETVHAQALGWPIPVYQQKWRTDANYEEQTRFLLRNHEHLRPAIASHNIRSLAYAIATARHIGLPMLGFELQMLYGMADTEKEALVSMGHRMRIYMPFGELIPGMAYLVRRLLENTSNDSFLRASFSEMAPPDELLKNPLERPEAVGSGDTSDQPASAPTSEAAQPTLTPHNLTTDEMLMFENQPLLNFSEEEPRTQFAETLKTVREQFGQHWPLVYGGEQVEGCQRIESYNPSRKEELLGTVGSASVEQATAAIEAAATAYESWQVEPVEERAAVLDRAADLMVERRYELAAWITYECGKGWREADADVCEAIDFCRYYAAGARQLQGHAHGRNVPGEENDFEYLPRGVTAVIAPWNFPLAILTGMTVAALVTGNTVIMKPAEQSSVVAAKLMQILVGAGVPAGVVNFLPGAGEVVGKCLVAHPQVAVIAFTGSRQVGLAIHAEAAQVSAAGTPQVKRVIAEMGGKNAIIVDNDADLDEAVLGVVHSAFGYQGQKCSACSRVIVLENAYDVFVERLVPAAQSLHVGPADDPESKIGPVIDQEAFDRIRKYIEIARSEGREMLAVETGQLAEQGYFVGPHIYADVDPSARIAQEEIFGPVLAVMKAKTLDDAFKIANGTDYALTGGIYSRSPEHLDLARRRMMVGNLYLNREITGAMVSRQPFGGFRMSGIGSKAGGPDYLLQFVVPRTITENTLRRGFAPPPEE